MSKIRIAALDPALSNLGIAIMVYDTDTELLTVDDLLLVQTEPSKEKKVRKNSDDMERCAALHDGMIAACQGCMFAIAEVPVGSQSARAMASYGACVMLLATCPLPLIQVTPLEVKRAATGRSSATKGEMIEWAMAEFPKAPWLMRKSKGELVPMNDNEHLADACAAGKAGIKTPQFQQALAMLRLYGSEHKTAQTFV